MLMNNIKKILKDIENAKDFKEFQEFKLDSKVNLSEDIYQKLIFDLNQEENKTVSYSKSYSCDSIDVIDIDGMRYITFEDNIYDLTNKGLDNLTSITTYDNII
tara:strand:- start:192 stop:500 length:309 start_codon:yes stop_codon:yes gene_type:complete